MIGEQLCLFLVSHDWSQLLQGITSNALQLRPAETIQKQEKNHINLSLLNLNSKLENDRVLKTKNHKGSYDEGVTSWMEQFVRVDTWINEAIIQHSVNVVTGHITAKAKPGSALIL